MEDPFTAILGVNMYTCFWITAFWSVLFFLILGTSNIVMIPILFAVFATIFMINFFGMILAIFMGAAILISAVYLLFRYADDISRFGKYLSNTSRPTPNYTRSTTAPVSSAHSFGGPVGNLQVPNILYHGTPTLQAAKDIYLNNRWKVSCTSAEHGIFMAEDFNVAKNYARISGFIVVVNVTLPSSSVIDTTLRLYDNDKTLAMGYRLLKMDNIYVGLLPKKSGYSQYYRVSGITPVGIMDTSKNQIYIN